MAHGLTDVAAMAEDKACGTCVMARKVLNTDAACFGGSGAWPFQGQTSESVAWHGRNDSLTVDLPPLAVLILKMRSSEIHA